VAFDSYRPRGFNKFGMVRGQGQQRGNSPYLDSPQDEEEREQPDLGGEVNRTQPVGQPVRMQRNIQRALTPPVQESSLNSVDPAAPNQVQMRSLRPRTYQPGPVNTMPVGSRPGFDERGELKGQMSPEEMNRFLTHDGNPNVDYGNTPVADRGKPVWESSAYQSMAGRPELQTQDPNPAPGGSWGANYEWNAGEGGPKVSDLQIGDPSRLTGFNTNAWGSGERGTESMKNTFGMIASRYGAKPSSMAQLVQDPDFQTFFPNAKLVPGGAGDKIDFGDGQGPVDVLKSADPNADTADAWAWQVGDGGAQQPNQPNPLDRAFGMNGQMGQGDDQSAAIFQALMSEGGSQGQLSIEQLLQALMQEQEAAGGGIRYQY